MLNNVTAASNYTTARAAVSPAGESAAQRIGNAAEDFARQMAQVDEVSTGAMAGQVQTHQLVQTLAEAELAMDTVVAIRDRVVEAYQEILRMPV